MAETIRSEETVGRAGLVIPGIPETPMYDGHRAVIFFQKLWELNGFDVSTESEYNGATYVKKPFNHELVIPPIDDKPLTVLKASYTVRDEREVEQQLERNRRWGGGYHDGVVSAVEKYAIAVPPAALGPFELVTSAVYKHGMGGLNWYRGETGGTYVTHNGKGLMKEIWTDFESIAAEMPEPIDARDLRDQRFEEAVTLVLQQTIEFLGT